MTTRFKPWMCWTCGYTMDAASPAGQEEIVPGDGDVSLCLNCGAVYCLHGAQWCPATTTELASLSTEQQRLLERALEARRQVVGEDLGKRDRRT